LNSNVSQLNSQNRSNVILL